MAGDAFLGRWVRCDCILGGRVVSSGPAACITPRRVVVSTTCMGAVADPLILATDFVGWTMRLLRER